MAAVGIHGRAVVAHAQKIAIGVHLGAELRDEAYEPGPGPAEDAGRRGLRGLMPRATVGGEERRRDEEQKRKDETGGTRARQMGHTNPFRERRLSPAPA